MFQSFWELDEQGVEEESEEEIQSRKLDLAYLSARAWKLSLSRMVWEECYISNGTILSQMVLEH